MDNIFKYWIFPVAVMVGGIIGVGFLSFPYIALKVGLWPIIFYLVVLTAVVLIIHLIFAEVSLRTPDHKRWPGFMGFYFGPVAKQIGLVLTIVGSLGVLLAYLIIGSQFLSAFASPFFGGAILVYVLIYFAVASFFIYGNVKAISSLNVFIVGFLLIALLFIFTSVFGRINFSSISLFNGNLNFSTLFFPYGPVMFALWGIGIIPQIEEMMAGRKKNLKKIIIASFVLVAVFYLLFTVMVVGISGNHTSDSALTGLKNFLAPGMFALALSIGIATTFIAYVAQGILLKQTLVFDMKIKEFSAWLMVCVIPLGLYFLGFHSFIPLISFVGGFILGIDGILILLMYRKIGGRKIIAYPLMIIFIVGIVYSLVHSK